MHTEASSYNFTYKRAAPGTEKNQGQDLIAAGNVSYKSNKTVFAYTELTTNCSTKAANIFSCHVGSPKI